MMEVENHKEDGPYEGGEDRFLRGMIIHRKNLGNFF